MGIGPVGLETPGMSTKRKAQSLVFSPTLARSFRRAFLLALYFTFAVAAWPAFAADGEVARVTTNPEAEGVLAAFGIAILTIGAAVARWFSEEPD